jgi:hypothetical protein
MAPLGALIVFLVYGIASGGGIAFLIALIRGWRPSSVGKILLLLAYLPFAVLAITLIGEERTRQKRQNKYGFIGLTQEALREYYQLYPDRFRRKGEDEEADVQGFAEWFRANLKERKGNWPEITRQFHFKNGQLLDLEGYPVRFALDFDRDYVIAAFGERVEIDRVPRPPGSSLPVDKYATALGIFCPPDTTIRYQKILKE